METKFTKDQFGAKQDVVDALGISENQILRSFQQSSFFMVLFALVLAALSIIGWQLNVLFLQSLFVGLDSRNMVTDVALILSGLSLLILLKRSDRENYVFLSRVLSTTVVVIATIRLTALVPGYTDQVSDFIFDHSERAYNLLDRTDDISVTTAINMLLLGSALLFLSLKGERLKYSTNLLSFTVTIISSFWLIAYMYGVTDFFNWLTHIPMSLHATFCFILISLAIQFSNTKVGFMRTMASPYLGGKLSRILIAYGVLVPLLFGFIRLWTNLKYPISVELGVTILILSIIVSFYILIWYLSRIINVSDIARISAEKRLKTFNQQLEQKVIDRTEELVKSENRFRSLVENSNDIIALLDKELKTIYRAPSSERITGWSEEDRQSMSALQLIHPDDLEMTSGILREAMANPGNVFDITLRLRNKNGAYSWLQGSITNMFNDPDVGAIVTNFRDVTEGKEAEEKIIKLNEELENKVTERTAELKEAITDLESFGYTVSHDLRTPLQVISAYSSVLAKKHCAANDVDAQAIVQEIKDYTRQMSRIIESLLRLSQSGRSVLKKVQVDMNDILSKVLAELRIVNQDNVTEIKVHSLHSAFCDEDLIKLIWMNLISNAIKYSRKTLHPFVEIGANELNGDTVYYVKDNGIGFDMQDAGKLFGAFQRLNQAVEFEGSGIGLAIVHRIVTRHGGRIWAESKKDEGAAFYFTLAPKQDETL